ncbi:MAG: hypothetical protein AB9842_07140 [Bacteroidales bacterium]
MKKLATVLFVAGMFAFFACGPSAEEKAAMEKAKQDSIAAVEKAQQDSIAMVVEKAKQDSIALADSIAQAEAAKKGKK